MNKEEINALYQNYVQINVDAQNKGKETVILSFENWAKIEGYTEQEDGTWEYQPPEYEAPELELD